MYYMNLYHHFYVIIILNLFIILISIFILTIEIFFARLVFDIFIFNKYKCLSRNKEYYKGMIYRL